MLTIQAMVSSIHQFNLAMPPTACITRIAGVDSRDAVTDLGLPAQRAFFYCAPVITATIANWNARATPTWPARGLTASKEDSNGQSQS
jgi:hypothetical protein